MVSTETTGVILNNELDDFATKAATEMLTTGAVPPESMVPETSTAVQGPNEPRPFARPTSSMTPTIAFKDGQPVLVVGGSGGLRIATGVTQAFLARTVFHNSVRNCVTRGRLHTPVDESPPDKPVIELDEDAPDALVQDLKSRGELVQLVPNYSGVEMVAIDRNADGAVHISAASDPRKGGVAAVE
jgi:gamma-glutamyltranspeptidase/glutathione hydrolase